MPKDCKPALQRQRYIYKRRAARGVTLNVEMIRLGGREAEFYLHEKGVLPTVSCACECGVEKLWKACAPEARL